jgi:hypothetical protein
MNADSRDLLGRSAYLSDKHFFRELLMRIELTTSSLPRKCSTTELQQLSAVIRYPLFSSTVLFTTNG